MTIRAHTLDLGTPFSVGGGCSVVVIVNKSKFARSPRFVEGRVKGWTAVCSLIGLRWRNDSSLFPLLNKCCANLERSFSDPVSEVWSVEVASETRLQTISPLKKRPPPQSWSKASQDESSVLKLIANTFHSHPPQRWSPGKPYSLCF